MRNDKLIGRLRDKDTRGWDLMDVAATELERQPTRETVERVLGELAGYASLCWKPRPVGDFDSSEATLAVARALHELYPGK